MFTLSRLMGGGLSLSRRWAAAGPLPPAGPLMLASPVVTGTEALGQTLACSTGSWGNSPTGYAYQWFRASLFDGEPVTVDGLLTGDPISGATSSSHLLVAGDANQRLYCEVTATNAAGSSLAQSAVTGLIEGSVAPSASAWSETLKNADFTLTNNDMTATAGPNSGYRSVFGTASHAAGKKHVEFVLDAFTSNGRTVGLATADEVLDNYLGIAGNKSLAFYPSGSMVLYYNDTIFAAVSPLWTPGDVVALEVDFDAGLLWVALNGGTWNQDPTANPATGVGGADISAITASGPLLPAFCTNMPGEAATLRVEAEDFTRAVSSGFSAWG